MVQTAKPKGPVPQAFMVVRAFWLGGDLQPIGAKVKLDATLATTLFHGGKISPWDADAAEAAQANAQQQAADAATITAAAQAQAQAEADVAVAAKALADAPKPPKAKASDKPAEPAAD